MADDGMLVNFAIDDSSFKPAPKIKGGTWKDRLVAKKLSRRGKVGQRPPLPLSGPNQQRLQPRRARAEGPQDDTRFSHPRVTKRRKQDGEFRPSTDFIPSSNAQDVRAEGATQPPRGDRPVISSLFSYNPKPQTAPDQQDDGEAQPAKPTNAPLIDGLDTFTTLGLSSTLAAHLLTKLELKDPTAIQKVAITQLIKEDADAFIQSETGSGKTLAYLLPLVQRIMNLSSTSSHPSDSGNNVHRDSGLFAIVLAPTRELCKQISVVLERVLGCAHWIVAGTVIGGEKKKSEKARLRKGINILVATPGRLADHLDNTKVLDISSVRWLVLDEGDRLMDLGFEEEIQKIVAKLDERQKSPTNVIGLPKKRTTILCSATMKMNVQRLGEISLKEASLIKSETLTGDTSESQGTAFLAPAQLQQSYTIVAAKLRLVTLIALLKRTFARKGSVMKAIVFVSCADSVDFHYEILSQEESLLHRENVSSKKETEDPKSDPKDPAQASSSMSPSPLLSSSSNPLTLYKLHGSLPQATRTQIVNTFSRSTEPSLLISTDVASRGLDLPNLDLVIEYDPAFSSEDHLHRIGRTARLGRDGRALIFLLPGEEEGYVEVLRQSYRDAEGARKLAHTSAEEILKRGFMPNNPLTSGSTSSTSPAKWEDFATTLQLNIERHVLAHPTTSLVLARKAYQSHIRAYATHTSSERKYFNIKSLHLGHLAKAFGLRDKPSGIGIPGRPSTSSTSTSSKKRNPPSSSSSTPIATTPATSTTTTPANNILEDIDTSTSQHQTEEDAEDRKKRMRAKMKMAMMIGAGSGEFNIA